MTYVIFEPYLNQLRKKLKNYLDRQNSYLHIFIQLVH